MGLHTRLRLLFPVFAAIFLSASTAFAQGEVSGVLGGLLGGNLEVREDLSVDTSLKNAVLYGFRGGWYGERLGVEGSYVSSPSGLRGEALEGLVDIDTRVSYFEGNALLFILPGDVSPFVTGGAGLSRLRFKILDLVETPIISKFGFNFGGGVKGNFDRISIRFDVRDHVTSLKAEDFGALGPIAGILGLDLDQTLHNLELSFGIGVRF
jgi:hypothetical protein